MNRHIFIVIVLVVLFCGCSTTHNIEQVKKLQKKGNDKAAFDICLQLAED